MAAMYMNINAILCNSVDIIVGIDIEDDINADIVIESYSNANFGHLIPLSTLILIDIDNVKLSNP